MAGMIFFKRGNWGASSWLTFYIMEHVADRAAESETKEQITELVQNNIPMLDLRDPGLASLVDIIADDLPNHFPRMQDQKDQLDLNAVIDKLIELAKEQQRENRSSQQSL
jgi:hypothetical protein